MNPKLLLRIAAGLLIFHLIGHSFGHSTWKQTIDPVKQEVINEMTGHSFLFMGTERSMADYYEGYGYTVSISLILVAILLVVISGSLNQNNRLAFKLTTVISVCLLAWCIDEFIFFFPFAAITTLLAAIFAFIAAFKLQAKTS